MQKILEGVDTGLVAGGLIWLTKGLIDLFITDIPLMAELGLMKLYVEPIVGVDGSSIDEKTVV